MVPNAVASYHIQVEDDAKQTRLRAYVLRRRFLYNADALNPEHNRPFEDLGPFR